MLLQDPQFRSEILSTASTPVRVNTVLVTGASGLLGSALCPVLTKAGHHVVRHGRTSASPEHSAFPLEHLERIEPAVRALRPDWIIHAAGNTNVDACELEPTATRRLHVEASAELARAAARHGSRLLYVSTDSVYDGDRAGTHAENDVVRPINEYARTKRAGELACLAALDSTLVARVNFFGLHPTRSQGLATWIVNTLKSGQALNGFTDVHFNPLLNHDLAELIAQALARDLPGGIYNYGAADACSKYEFARRLATLIGADERLVRPATLADAALRTPRPRNTVMNTGKLAAALNRPLPTINTGLARLLTSPDVCRT